jgi:hypothetical protein
MEPQGATRVSAECGRLRAQWGERPDHSRRKGVQEQSA